MVMLRAGTNHMVWFMAIKTKILRETILSNLIFQNQSLEFQLSIGMHLDIIKLHQLQEQLMIYIGRFRIILSMITSTEQLLVYFHLI